MRLFNIAMRSFVVIFLITLYSPLIAQHTAKRTGGGVGYLEYLPPDYATNPTRQYPLMLFLHGAGEKGSGNATDLEKVKRNGPPKEIERGHNMCFNAGGTGPEDCFIVISPQLTGGKPSWGISYIEGVLNYVLNGPENYRVDPTRIYLTGLSLGANGVYKFAYLDTNDPPILAAISPIAGWADTNKGCVISERKTPLWAFHGDADNTVGYGSGLAMFNSVLNCTTPPPTQDLIFTTYAGVGHNSWGRAYTTDNSLHDPNIYEWFLLQSLGGAPSANAGSDKNITLPTNSVTLNGSGSDADGTITSYAWTKLSGPTASLNNQNTANLSVSNLLQGVYVFELTVTDNDGNTATDQATVTVNPMAVNQNPTANAGTDQSLTLPVNSTNLTGSGNDPDGTIAGYAWTQQSGPNTATLAGASSSTASISNLIEGTYVFRLTVTDNDGATAFDNIQVTVNPAAVNQLPTANAGADKNLVLPTNSTNLVGSGNDPDGTITTYLWEKISGPNANLANPNLSTVSISALVEGNYTFRLTVTDNDGATATDQANVTVLAANVPPVVNAGTDKTITLPTSTAVFNGSASDSDGSIASYAWTQVSGPSSANLANQTTPTLTVSALIQGVYKFRLTVVDDDGASSLDEVNVTVNSAPVNVPPTANAGTDKSITLPTNSVLLNGSGNDTDGTIASYAWIKVSGPTANLSNQNTPNLTAGSLLAGTYVFRLTVTDNDGATGTDQATVVVSPATVNQSPVVNAGADKAITLPTNSVIFNGSASDPDGTIVSYQWSQLSGPSSATLTGTGTINLTASNLISGNYQFELEVTDNDGATSSDVVGVSVNAANQPPVVNAGSNIVITLPTNSTNITGTASDSDGTITTILWTQRSGNAASLTNQNSLVLTVSSLVEGTYVFRLTVIDNNGSSSFDEVTVTVLPDTPNSIPVANAGADVTITLPTNTAVLTGSGTDSDGTITSYAWTKSSGPGVTLGNSNTPALTLSNLVQGIYVFKLTVTDNDGATAFDEVTVLVNPATVNQPPVANAGTNITITLPVNSTTINGSGTDTDGSIASYQWTKVSGPSATLSNTTTATLSLSDLVEGTYIFRLTVTDDDGATDADEVTVSVQPNAVNQSPIANAGNDINLVLPTNSTNIVGSGSDPDGTIASYAWAKLSGPVVTIAGSTNPVLSVSALVEGVYVFRLTVTDNDGAIDNDDMTLTVSNASINQAPVANAGSDLNLSLPTNSATINGSGTDIDGTIANYDWVKLSGGTATLTNADQPSLQVTDLVEGTYTFRLTVTDDDGDSDSDEMQIIVQPAAVNNSPVADAGANQSIILPVNSTTLNGSGTDTDGSITTYLWTQESGPAATMMNLDQPTLTIQDLVEGAYVFRLTVTDDGGATDFDEATITVLPMATNLPPIANAGGNKNVNLPTNTIDLTGTGTDTDGTVTAFLWEKISGPSLTFSDPTSALVTLNDLLEGVYEISLTVTDDDGATDDDIILVSVLPSSVNSSPTANAGGDTFLPFPTNNTVLNGSGTDPDGTIASYAWTKESGPAGGTLSGEDTEDLTLTNLEAGNYIFRLSVTDDGGLTAFDDAEIIVEPESDPDPNDAPQADAGDDQVLILPANSTRLIGSFTDDGLIDGMEWVKVSGPNADFTRTDSTVVDVTNLEEGAYEFEFRVTDSEGLTGTDIVAVNVRGDGGGQEFGNAMLSFSPNSDGLNDFWVLDQDLSKLTDCQLMIYDRRGIKVFEANPYLNDWDATIQGGELSSGVYYYVLNCPGSSGASDTGSITVVR